MPDDATVARLNVALEAARSLLGGRIVDLAYWTVAGVLDDWDPAWAAWAHPRTQPPSRFWLVERPDLVAGPGLLDTPIGVAFEDHAQRWWIWEPATESFHNDTSWLATDYYSAARAHTRTMVRTDSGRLRFTALSCSEAAALIATGAVDGAGADWLARRRNQQPRLPLADAIAEVKQSGVDRTGALKFKTPRAVEVDPGTQHDEIDLRFRDFAPLPRSALESADQVQIGESDVSLGVLDAEGVALDVVLADYRPLDVAAITPLIESQGGSLRDVPAGGWRVVTHELTHFAVVTLAAPHPIAAGGWVLLNLVQRDEIWQFGGYDPQPAGPRPGRTSRRRALRLFWPHPIREPAGAVPTLNVALQNISKATLGGTDDLVYGEDSPNVAGWIIEKDGTPLPGATGISWSSTGGIPRLKPGEIAELPVHLLTVGINALPPDSYRIHATLVSLHLDADDGTLELQ